MKYTWKIGMAAVFVMSAAPAVKADLSLGGQTGLFINPTAGIVEKKHPEVAGQYVRYSDRGYHINGFSVHGALQAVDSLEVSASYIHYGDKYSYSENNWRIGAKYQILNQQEKGIDLAVGADFLQYNANIDGNAYALYLAATRDFTLKEDRAPIKGTLGLRWDKDDPDGYDSSSKASVFGGVEIPLTRTGQVSLIGELASKSSDHRKSVWDVGVRYHPRGTGFSLGAGYGSIWGLQRGSTWFAQVGYQFGK